MTSTDPRNTQLLKAWSEGDHTAWERLAPTVYEQRRGMSRRHMRREPARHKTRVIELHFSGGLSVEETALRTSPQSVMRDWKVEGLVAREFGNVGSD